MTVPGLFFVHPFTHESIQHLYARIDRGEFDWLVPWLVIVALLLYTVPHLKWERKKNWDK